MTTLAVQDRFERQRDLVPTEKINSTPVAVVGCGAVGRQLTLLLVAMGVLDFELWDDDVVDETNRTTQGWKKRDVGRPKVEVLREEVLLADPDAKVSARREKFRDGFADPRRATFCCVDSMGGRYDVWGACKYAAEPVEFFCDARMLGETIRVFTALNPAEEPDDGYPSTLFPEAEAVGGRCTARSTIYTAAGCAALMCHQFRRYLTGEPVDGDLMLALASSDIMLGVGV